MATLRGRRSIKVNTKMASTGQGDQTQGAVRVNGFNDVPKPFLIGVGGGTASGKVCECVLLLVIKQIVCIINQQYRSFLVRPVNRHLL